MGFVLPSGVVNTDSAYFYPDASLSLGPLVKQVADQTLVFIDYSNLQPSVLVSTFTFAVDVTSNPALVVSYAKLNIIGDVLAFLVSGGIAGQQYNIEVTANSSGSSRTDTLTINIPSSGDCSCDTINPVPTIYTQLPLGEPTQGYINSAVRYFWGNAPPANPSVMDQWYNPGAQTLYEWATDGVSFFWQTLMSSNVVTEAPQSGLIFGRYNGYWAPTPIQTDAPSNGILYSRRNGAWALDVFQTDAPSDGLYYGRRNSNWAAVPTPPISSDAPIDGNTYGRLNAAWTVIPPQVIGVDAPADNNSYMRNNRGWTSGGRITGSLAVIGNVTIGGTLSVQQPSYFTGNVTAYGSVAISNDPIAPEQAANKHYVDNAIQAAFNSNGYPFLQLSGGTMAGAITLAADPAQPMQPVTLQYFNAHAPGGLTDAPADGNAYGRLNSTWQTVLSTAGGAILGQLFIQGGVANVATAAATKGYVDASITASVPQPSGSAPPMDGAAVPGVSLAYARADHVHPTDTTRYSASNPSNYQTLAQVNAALANYYPTTNPAGYATTAQVTAMLVPYALISSIPAASTAIPLMDGVAVAGTSAAWARGDHVHPTDTSRASITQLGNYLPLTGGTLTGTLTLASDPTTNLGAATKQYVDNANIDCGTF